MDDMESRVERRGLMLVLSSPSGAGKTTISRMVLERDEEISLSISVTTRPKRPGEVDGRDYHFVDRTEFNLMLNRRELLEHAKVFDHYYGTPKVAVEEALVAGRDVLFDIDWQGEQQLKQSVRNDLASIFILPPSTEELARRLQSRAQDPASVVAARMAKAPDEISHWPEYDYIIVNHEIDDSVAQVQAILAAERLKRERQIGLTDFVKRLREWR
ncbi:MAG: Guanylate kinase [Alphaproteobacteria bacterium MarineAlpha11_Bin1]|nr:MAG: Guanylate kinase [Alphaproteobacteria bacterium MarineAlpha11_Bin1]|tara:strand:- start:1826 stop:2470 length:645 start_codon:yes stop_codon:yes gene_type:complete